MATYYVSSSYTGATSNGTQLTPWKSLSQVQTAMSSFVAGDSILFKAGDTFTGKLSISRSGSAGNPIIFGSYGSGSRPKFTGTGATISVLFSLYNINYITFQDLEILDPTIDVTSTTRIVKSKIERAFEMDGTSNHNTIQRCTITAVGIAAYWVGGNNIMDNCDVGDLTMVVDTNDGSQPGNDDDYGANPIVLGSSSNTITNNRFFRCWAHSYDYTVDGGAIEFYLPGGTMSNNFMCFNLIYDTDGIFEIVGNTTNNVFAYNKVINCAGISYMHSGYTHSNFAVHNNTILETAAPVNPSTGDTLFGGGSLTGSAISLKNNVFYLTNGMKVANSTTGLVLANNIYKVTNPSVIGYTITGTELNTSATAAALFTAASNPLANLWDVTPAASSALVNFGASLGYSVDFNGNTLVGNPDTGAVERMSGTSGGTPLTMSATGSNVPCNGGTSVITVTAAGGSGTYTGTGTFTVSAGSHTYTVGDGVSSISQTVIISQPAPLTASISIGVIGASTLCSASAFGGTAPYTFSFDGGSFTSTSTASLIAGTHTIATKDANGCVSPAVSFLISATSMRITLVKVNTTCKNTLTGSVTIRGTGGTAPFSFRKGTSGSFVSSNLFTGLGVGFYTFQIKDGTGKIVTKYTNITAINPNNC